MADNFKSTNFTAGQEVRAVDLINTSKFLEARFIDQLLSELGGNFPGSALAGVVANNDASQFAGSQEIPVNTGWYAYCLNPGSAYLLQGSANNKVRVSRGTLFHKSALDDGNAIQMLPYTFDGSATYEWTIANGDPVNPRVDLLQMALTWETADLQARVFANSADYARILMGAHCTNFNTHLRARVMGLSGNNIQVKTQTGGAAAYAENGNQVTFTFVDGVTTVAALEALIPATAIVAVDVAGTAANILHAVGDVIALTNLTGGIDTVLVSQNLNMQNRVKCTLSVKQGVAAASPVYPDPDAGVCVVGAVVVGATYAGASALLFEDTAGAVAVVHDQRMPLGIKQSLTPQGLFEYATWPGNAGVWVPAIAGTGVEAVGGGGLNLYIPYVGRMGRLVGVTLGSVSIAVMSTYLQKRMFSVSGVTYAQTHVNLNIAPNLGDQASSTYGVRSNKIINFQGAHHPAVGPTVLQNPTSGMGPPVWTNGKRAMIPLGQGATNPPPMEQLSLNVIGQGGDYVTHATFLVAEGI